ncbi:MAG: hypothetical protein MHPSP_003554, partial [Paramarteilia canceri]
DSEPSTFCSYSSAHLENEIRKKQIKLIEASLANKLNCATNDPVSAISPKLASLLKSIDGIDKLFGTDTYIFYLY